jgi:hypothetical protein
MLIPFRSAAAGDFFMQEPYVRVLFVLMNKPFAPQGILVADQLENHLRDLQAGLNAGADDSQAASDEDGMSAVGLKQRAWPLIDMLNRSLKKKVDVTWGVSRLLKYPPILVHRPARSHVTKL